jgi:hypothetical protein
MIIGAHSIIYSTKPEADRAFLGEMLGLPSVDAGKSWLIFGLPPAEVAVHPSDENDVHEFYLMCDDVESFAREMTGLGITCTARQNMGWGVLTQITLPGGGKLGVYEPRHARPKSMGAKRKVKVRVRSTKKRTVKKVVGKATIKARRKSRSARA